MSGEHLRRGAQWRQAARDVLAPVTESLAVAAGHKPAWSDIVLLDGYRVRRAAECMARPPDDGGEYVESSRNLRRRVGLAVLAVLREEPSSDPLSAYEEVLATRSHWFSAAVVSWIDLLGPGGRAALAREACGYAAAVAAWVPPSRMGAVAFAAPGDWFSWTVPDRAVRVRGRCEALTPRGGRPPDRGLLLVSNHLESARFDAAHLALSYTLSLGSVPARVTVLAPQSGKAVVPVDDDLLDLALDRVATAAHSAVAARFGPEAPTSAGPWCRSCQRLSECDDGQKWVATRPLLHGGLSPLRPAD